ncbi:MAG: hypothetical protein Q7T33_06960 [Dehalococcoidia bacterium]|nr:hypothetical protein [Dehalococcoidia bacterium]
MSWFVNGLFRRKRGEGRDGPPPADRPQEPGSPLIVLMPHAAGPAAFQIETFPNAVQAELHLVDRFRGQAEEGVIAFWALAWQPDSLPGDARAEPLVIIHEAARPGVVYPFSFVDMDTAMSFLRQECERGLDQGLVRVYWAVTVAIEANARAGVTLTPDAPPVREPGRDFGGLRPTGWVGRSNGYHHGPDPLPLPGAAHPAYTPIEQLIEEHLNSLDGAFEHNADAPAYGNGGEPALRDAEGAPTQAGEPEFEMGKIIREMDQVLEDEAIDTPQVGLRLDALIKEMEALLAQAAAELEDSDPAVSESPGGGDAPSEPEVQDPKRPPGTPGTKRDETLRFGPATLYRNGIEQSFRPAGKSSPPFRAGRPDPLSRHGVRHPINPQGAPKPARPAEDGLQQFSEHVAQMREELAKFRKSSRWRRRDGDFQGFGSPPGRF